MVATEKQIVQLLDDLSTTLKGLKQAIDEDLPYSKVKELYDQYTQLKAEIKSAVESVQLAPDQKQRIFKSTDGQVASKLTVKQPLKADAFIEDMVENHRDEFLARAKACCNIVKGGWSQNPIPGVDINDPKYLSPKEFTATTTNTYKMGTVLMESMEWAFDYNNVKYVEEGATILERMEAMLDSAYRLFSSKA